MFRLDGKVALVAQNGVLEVTMGFYTVTDATGAIDKWLPVISSHNRVVSSSDRLQASPPPTLNSRP